VMVLVSVSAVVAPAVEGFAVFLHYCYSSHLAMLSGAWAEEQ
jgi:hypothetical protein